MRDFHAWTAPLPPWGTLTSVLEAPTSHLCPKSDNFSKTLELRGEKVGSSLQAPSKTRPKVVRFGLLRQTLFSGSNPLNFSLFQPFHMRFAFPISERVLHHRRTAPLLHRRLRAPAASCSDRLSRPPHKRRRQIAGGVLRFRPGRRPLATIGNTPIDPKQGQTGGQVHKQGQNKARNFCLGRNQGRPNLPNPLQTLTF